MARLPGTSAQNLPAIGAERRRLGSSALELSGIIGACWRQVRGELVVELPHSARLTASSSDLNSKLVALMQVGV